MIIDNHVHVGWYRDGYHAPLDVWNNVKAAGINEIVVSSTSTCAELYDLVVEEMNELVSFGGNLIHPVLWLTPQMMQTSNLNYMLSSNVKWQMIKMHWKAHPEWYIDKSLVSYALGLAKELRLPILLHTGNFEECRAGVFKDICREQTEIVFVLAHGCPLNETIKIMQECNNVYVDTAFMPAKNVKKLIQIGLLDRILFGSDVPINELYFPKKSSKEYLIEEIGELQKVIGNDWFSIISKKKVV